GIKPVVARLECQAGRCQQSLVSSPGYLKENFLLLLQQKLAVIQPPREKHQPVDINQLLRTQPVIALSLFADCFRSGLGLGFGGGGHGFPSYRMTKAYCKSEAAGAHICAPLPRWLNSSHVTNKV